MKFKGALTRLIKEYKYYTIPNWSYQDVGDFWDTVDDYDEIDDETYAYKRRFYDSIKMCTFPDNSKVLDLDCRTGNGTSFYHQNGKVKEAVCVSPSPVFLDVCKERTKKYGVQAEHLLFRELPLLLEDKSFDAILCLETVEHISTHKEFLTELHRLLKDDGELILTMPNILWEPVHWFAAIFEIHHSEGPHRFLSRKRMKKLLRESDLKIMKEDTTVIIPAGPRWLTTFGEKIEKAMGKSLRHLFALRHIMIIKKRIDKC